MSSWGTGIKQSDEFLDVYEEFFDKYVDGTDPLAIFSEIWQEYRGEFPEDHNDPILHTIRFALAQCLWECGTKDESLWNEIDEIITTGKDLKFWGDLGADESLKRKRKKSLEEFWLKINSTPKRIRYPKKNSVPRAPTLHKGDIFAYADPRGGYRAADTVQRLFLKRSTVRSFLQYVTIIFPLFLPKTTYGTALRVMSFGHLKKPPFLKKTEYR